MFLCRHNEQTGADEYLNLAQVESVEYDGSGAEPVAVLHFAGRDVWLHGADARRVADWCCDRDFEFARQQRRGK